VMDRSERPDGIEIIGKVGDRRKYWQRQMIKGWGKVGT
jgi:hypothetical protein